MHARRMLASAVLAFTLGLSLAGAVMANRSIVLSPGTRELEAFSTSMSVTFADEEASFRVNCTFRYTFRFNRVFAKTVGATIGSVVGWVAERCSGGTMRVLGPEVRDPWPIRYESFRGTLPNITELVMQWEIRSNGGFLVESFFGLARCLFGGNGTLQGMTSRGNPIIELRQDSVRTFPLFDDRLTLFPCPGNGRLSGTQRVLSPSTRMSLT